MTMMAQQNAAQQGVREEERVLGITYERALAMVPNLIREASSGDVETFGDGYFVATTKGSSKREMTVRLGRQGADTRFSVRVESTLNGRMIGIAVLVGMLTLGIGMIVLLPWMISAQRREARERDLLVHKTFRAIEDAVANQGAAANYRVAPGADAVAQERDHAALEEGAADESASVERARRRSS